MIEIPRFSVVDIDVKNPVRKGIKDHSNGRIVVIVNNIESKETTLSVAENIIPVIEDTITSSDDTNGEG